MNSARARASAAPMRTLALVLMVPWLAGAQPLSTDQFEQLNREVDAANAAARDAALAKVGLARLSLNGAFQSVKGAAAPDWTWKESERLLVSPLQGSCQPVLAFAQRGDDFWALEEHMELPYTKRQVETRCAAAPPAPPQPPASRQRCQGVVRFKVPGGLHFKGVRVVTAPFTQLVATCGPSSVELVGGAAAVSMVDAGVARAEPAPAGATKRARFCDRRQLACRQPEPACAAGMTALDGACFSSCVPITECSCDEGHQCPAGASCRGGRCEK